MTTLVLGANGQVGRELLRALAGWCELVAATRNGQLVDGHPCERADFCAPDALRDLLDRVKPDVVINAAAYTAVDKAEADKDVAMLTNAEGPALLAAWCAAHQATLVHYSTDYVFDGAGERPYLPDDPVAPLGVYGSSKLAGEVAIREAGAHHLIFRTAWVYASHGQNFLRTMLRVGAERDLLRVVADQIGTPTPAALIADVTAQVLARAPEASGVWHLTATGQTSWHGFAEEIFGQAARLGLVDNVPTIEAITTAEYPTPARRPAFSCLDTTSLQSDFDVKLPAWELGVTHVLRELANAQDH